MFRRVQGCDALGSLDCGADRLDSVAGTACFLRLISNTPSLKMIKLAPGGTSQELEGNLAPRVIPSMEPVEER